MGVVSVCALSDRSGMFPPRCGWGAGRGGIVTALDVTALREAAQQEITDGLRACQLAVARNGEVVWTESFGDATDASRFLVMSATKPIVASAAWMLIGEGTLELDRRVADYIPELATNGKDAITVEQVFIMT